jgi:nitric oxide dioxygenase
MTPEQLDLVESSLVAVGPRLNDVAAAFYVRLFEIDPSARELFGVDPAVQRTKFASELAFIVSVMRRHVAFIDTAGELGRRHAASGVGPEHFRTGGVALLEVLAVTLGDAWTPAVADAWRLAYRLTTEAMLARAARPRAC